MPSKEPLIPKAFKHKRHCRFLKTTLLVATFFAIISILLEIDQITNLFADEQQQVINNLSHIAFLLAVLFFFVGMMMAHVPAFKLSASELNEFTTQAEAHPELYAFVIAIKLQDRLPLKEDYNRLMRYVSQKETFQAEQEAETQWDNLSRKRA